MRLTREQRHVQAVQWAENWKERTGNGPGTSGYVNAYLCGYFDHSMSRSDGVVQNIIKQFEALETEIAPIQAALEHDRTKVAECLTAVKGELHSYSWLIDSRGSYKWNDDRWHEEFRHAHEAISQAIEPLVRIAADWSNCPKDWKDVQAAREGKQR